jgi:predicted metal-binding membrane protein
VDRAYDPPALARTLRVPAALTALALGGWFVTARLMDGMEMMDGAWPLASFLWLWLAMSAAMMLPTIVPATYLATALGRSATLFVLGYSAVWAAAGLLAFGVARALDGAARWLAVGAVLLAALYQLTPLKDTCLRRCRSPMGTLVRRRSLRAGIEHGALCLGCCWALMLALIALGVGSMLWMVALAVVVLVEKVAPLGERAPALVAAGLAGAAVWIAV